jgi:UDP-N-acetylmuramate--alanine ligase
MDVTQLKRIYFVGIGGIGMSALARFFKQRNAAVAGYDLAKTDLTKKLQEEGIEIIYTDDVSLVDKKVELVVYTPAIPKTNQILNWYRDNN